MSISIDTFNRISIDGIQTGLAVFQRENGTVVYTPESRLSNTAYVEHKMPQQRYSLAHDAPASGVAGLLQFEADIKELLKNIRQEKSQENNLSVNNKTAYPRTDLHSITCVDGTHQIRLDIFEMDRVEAIDVYDLPSDLYCSGGWRVEGMINGNPAGTQFYSGNLGSHFCGKESDDIARDFLADARKTGVLSPLSQLFERAEKSISAAIELAKGKASFELADPNVDKSISGKVMGVTDCHVVLSLGRTALIVAQSDLDRVPAKDEEVSVTFKDGKGTVQPGKERGEVER